LEVGGGRFEATEFLPPTSSHAKGVTILKSQTAGPRFGCGPEPVLGIMTRIWEFVH
jgi:hypothetical protein